MHFALQDCLFFFLDNMIITHGDTEKGYAYSHKIFIVSMKTPYQKPQKHFISPLKTLPYVKALHLRPFCLDREY